MRTDKYVSHMQIEDEGSIRRTIANMHPDMSVSQLTARPAWDTSGPASR